jgi:hypothetical protein
MLNLKRMLALSGLTGIVAALAIALPAQAVTGKVSAACAIQGHAHADVDILGGGGTYAFASFTAKCAVQAKGSVGTVDLSIASNGNFTNTVCGTGTATDPKPVLTQTGGDPTVGAKLVAQNLGYTVTFAGGQGALTFLPTASVTGGGPINISPDPNEPGTGTCTKGFNVVGGIAGSS